MGTQEKSYNGKENPIWKQTRMSKEMLVEEETLLTPEI